MSIIIGIDPHKASHTAVAIDNTECVLDELRVRACASQTDRLRSWAAPFPDRVWAIESARWLGYLRAGSSDRSLPDPTTNPTTTPPAPPEAPIDASADASRING